MIISEFLGLIGMSILITFVVCSGFYCGAIIGNAIAGLISND